VRALTADLLAATANVNRPLEAIEYLLQYHGTGLAVRDSTSYTTAKAFLADYAITISVDLLGNPDTREVIDGICQEIGLEQYATTTGLHAVRWPHDVTGTSAGQAFSGAVGITDLHDVIGHPRWQESGGGDDQQINTVDHNNNHQVETLTDSDAVASYGVVKASSSPAFQRGLVLNRSSLWCRIQNKKEPRHVVQFGASLDLLKINLGDIFRATLRDAPALGGWTDRPVRLRRVEVDPLSGEVTAEALDRQPVESSASFYLAPRTNWEVNTFSATWTTGNRRVTTADGAAASVRVGDYLWFQAAAGTDDTCLARVLKRFSSGGTYYLETNRAAALSTGAKTTSYLQTELEVGTCGSLADAKHSTNALYTYLATSSPVAAISACEVDSGIGPLDTAYLSGTTVREMTVTGTRTFSYEGQFGPVFILDGSTAYYQFGTAYSDLQIVDTLTICCWVRITGAMGAYNFVGCGGPASGTSTDNILYQFYCNANGSLALFWEYDAGVNVSVTTPATGLISNDGIYFLIVTRSSAGVCRFYVGTNTTTPALVHTSIGNTAANGGSNSKLCIGANAYNFASKIPGWVQGTLVYNAVLDAATIATLWTAGKRAACSVVC